MIEKFYMVTYSTLPMQMGFASEVKGWSVNLTSHAQAWRSFSRSAQEAGGKGQTQQGRLRDGLRLLRTAAKRGKEERYGLAAIPARYQR